MEESKIVFEFKYSLGSTKKNISTSLSVWRLVLADAATSFAFHYEKAQMQRRISNDKFQVKSALPPAPKPLKENHMMKIVSSVRKKR